jgi:hypothetical protein
MQTKVAPGSLEVNAMLAVGFIVLAGGPETIVVSGGMPISHSYSAGISPATPYALTALTSNMYSPSGRVL